MADFSARRGGTFKLWQSVMDAARSVPHTLDTEDAFSALCGIADALVATVAARPAIDFAGVREKVQFYRALSIHDPARVVLADSMASDIERMSDWIVPSSRSDDFGNDLGASISH